MKYRGYNTTVIGHLEIDMETRSGCVPRVSFGFQVTGMIEGFFGV